MKAVVFEVHGGPEVLSTRDIPDPVPGPGEVLVRVRACALNHLDIWVRQGIPGIAVPLPHIPGSDVAGVVAALGPGVSPDWLGRRVMLAPGLSCGLCPACAAGQDHLCDRYDILGQTSDGGCAELVKAPAANLISLPDNLSFESGAAFPLVFLTAWHMLVAVGKVRPGETVLVHAAGSGVGSAAIQVARLFGARVIATIGSEEKRPRAVDLGAEAVNYNDKDFRAEVLRLTDHRGVDLVVEHVGEETFEKSLMSLRKGGRLVTCGATSGRKIGFDLRMLFGRNVSIHGTRMGTRAGLLQAVEHLKAGRLRPVIDRTFPLAQAADAHRRMENRQNFGKIVLTVQPQCG